MNSSMKVISKNIKRLNLQNKNFMFYLHVDAQLLFDIFLILNDFV